jgi:hypothetical protein
MHLPRYYVTYPSIVKMNVYTSITWRNDHILSKTLKHTSNFLYEQ